MATEQPTSQQREEVALRLEDLIDALIEHPLWRSPPNQNPTLFFTWDFVMRSKYMLSEYDSILAGRAVQFPSQFQGGAGSGEAAAVKVFRDVCSRTVMLEMMVNDTSGRTAMMTGNSGPAVDFGQRVKDAVKALMEACPEDHVLAGMMD
ncbi:uncharacterized protein LY89DRAFT_630932 [Mollisia scopiformis]|uniref:Uncharacterized protein n=1 Tax=Mollisia scopiformis TaxID=149040 RepID=A0A132B7A6_MOLSC|nr:uncharacterized protein LY89DRAFT_630932 [Mollisia scopiformis]KUJ07879.1 hypothetical protein LY89DRAFT_630932 [Mollisia scopiformis]